jgi:hypothetical protein
MNEARLNTIFKSSVKKYGGFSVALTGSLYSGLPDLYVNLPGLPPMVMEAKYLKQLPVKFKRKIPYTAMQTKFLDDCHAVNPGTSYGLIGFQRCDDYFISLVSPGVTVFKSESIKDFPTTKLVGGITSGYFNLIDLFPSINTYTIKRFEPKPISNIIEYPDRWNL